MHKEYAANHFAPHVAIKQNSTSRTCFMYMCTCVCECKVAYRDRPLSVIMKYVIYPYVKIKLTYFICVLCDTECAVVQRIFPLNCRLLSIKFNL